MQYYDYVVLDENGKPVKPSFKERFSKGLKKCSQWMRDNQDWLVVVIPAVTVLTGKVIKRHNLHKEEHVKEFFCYDRRLGHYWELKRKLSNKEWLEIDARKKAGERLGDILAEFKVLK